MQFLCYIIRKGLIKMKNSKSLLKTTAAAVGVLHCINKFIDSNSLSHSTSKSSGQYYNWKHGNIFYKVAGTGEPLLLIHDLNVFSSSYEWMQIANQLSDSYTVYTLDLIGCGKSDKPALTYTNYFYVQLIQNFITNVIGQKTKVAATGLSASFVLMTDLMNNNLFDEIMLISPKSIESLKATPSNQSKILLRLFELPVIGKTAYYIATNQTNTEYFLSQKSFHNPLNVKPGIIKAYYDAAHTSKGEGKSLLASIEGNYLHADITRALQNTNKRILIVNGLHDESRKHISASYQKLNAHLVFEVISDAKTLPQLENVSEMAELMYHF